MIEPIHAEETPHIVELFNGYYVAYDTDGNITDYNMTIPQEEYVTKINQETLSWEWLQILIGHITYE